MVADDGAVASLVMMMNLPIALEILPIVFFFSEILSIEAVVLAPSQTQLLHQ